LYFIFTPFFYFIQSSDLIDSVHPDLFFFFLCIPFTQNRYNSTGKGAEEGVEEEKKRNMREAVDDDNVK
jgi:hypothetical protein